MAGITLLGLGPGNPDLLTRQAWRVLENASEVYLRTRQHPVVETFPPQLQVYSFDHLYERAETFEEVYEQIILQILSLGQRPTGVIYAVPGHPFVAESTAPEIARRARESGIPVDIVEGMSFLEPVFSALGRDPFPHLSLVDALELAALHVPSFPPNQPALIAQIHSPFIASDVKLTLMAHYPDEHPVILLHAAGVSQQIVEEMALYEIDRSNHIGLLTTLYVPPLGIATAFEAFQEVIAHLRAPDGCPWDREQTHQTLRSHLLEETYEALAALDDDDPQAMCEEFGDLLLQVVLHAQIAAEYGEFTMADILAGVYQKIVNRHPHVFGDVQLPDVQGVLVNWERLKEKERAANGKADAGLLDGVASALPALVQAEQYQQRAARVGFDWTEIQGVWAKLHEEIREVESAADLERQAEEIGDVLFAVVNLARWLRIDAESALREANARFFHRFGRIEAAARKQGRSIADLSLDEMETYWQEAKRQG